MEMKVVSSVGHQMKMSLLLGVMLMRRPVSLNTRITLIWRGPSRKVTVSTTDPQEWWEGVCLPAGN
jgi:hypothetical protein